MILLLAGRKGSGKSLVAQEAKKRGFKEVNFADRLKHLVASLYDWTVDELYCPVKKEDQLTSPVFWDASTAQKLAQLVGTDKKLRTDKQVFESRRQALQFIGTEVLRDIDPEFHIKEFRRQVADKDGLYVCTDGRFANEVDVIKELGGTVVYIIRPGYWDYSNHASETSVDRNHCDYVLVNNCGMNALLGRFAAFLDAWLSGEPPAECKRLLGPAAKRFCDKDAFHYPSPWGAYWAGVLSASAKVKLDKCASNYVIEMVSANRALVEALREFIKSDKPIHRTYRKRCFKPRYRFTIDNPYIVEDMKSWSISPGMSNEQPSCIQNDDKLLVCWHEGRSDAESYLDRRSLITSSRSS